mgnify:CR=1 FL=1
MNVTGMASGAEGRGRRRNALARKSGEGEKAMEKNTPLTEALFYILLSVREPNHGYGIIQEVERLTEGRVVLGPGTLYGAIQTMTERGWIRIFSQETDSRKKKQYVITELGRSIFAAEKARLAELLRNAELMKGI